MVYSVIQKVALKLNFKSKCLKMRYFYKKNSNISMHWGTPLKSTYLRGWGLFPYTPTFELL